MPELRLYILQRVSAAILAPLVLIHLGMMIYAIQGGLDAAEIRFGPIAKRAASASRCHRSLACAVRHPAPSIARHDPNDRSSAM